MFDCIVCQIYLLSTLFLRDSNSFIELRQGHLQSITEDRKTGHERERSEHDRGNVEGITRIRWTRSTRDL